MAKSLLLNALHDTLSDYVVGLSPESLKVGVWSGRIELNQLQVNPEAVNQLRLPVNIIHGTIEKLEVDIPWTKLGSKAVKVLLQGVSVLVGPVDRDSWGDDEVRERRLGIKRASLKKAESEAKAKKEKGKGEIKEEKKGFVDKLVQRIVDNIEINVADIHIRYEDPALVPGQTISAGVCLESFVVTTTDNTFEPKFVDRTGRGAKHKKVHKLARVSGFSVYWRVDDEERFELVPEETRSDALRKFVGEQAKALPADDDNGGGLKRGFLIQPIGAVLKFIHSDDPDDKTGPKFEATFEMDDVKMGLRAEQYEQALTLKDSLAALSNWQTFFHFRPKTSPLKDPKAWWRYAFVCVSGKPHGWERMNKVLMARKEYVSLFEKLAAEGGDTVSKPSSKDPPMPLTQEEKRRLDVLEEELPLQTIIMFRSMARNELKRKREEEKAKSDRKKENDDDEEDSKKGGGWWSNLWGGGGSSHKEEGDMDFEELTDFDDASDEKKVPPDYLQMRVTVRPQGSMRLYGRRDHPLVEARLVASATAEMREDSSMAISFRLSKLNVLDLFTQGAVFPHMLKVGGHDDEHAEDGDDAPELKKAGEKVAAAVLAGARASPKLQEGTAAEDALVCVNVSMSKTALEVIICALPTDLVYNREAVDAVVTVFSTRPAEAEAAMSNATKGFEAAQEKSKELAGLAITLSLDVAAPRVVVPVSSSRDEGFVLVDMGHVLVQGGSLESGAMAYKAELTDMNVRLPAKKALMIKGTGDAVVEPFKIEAAATIGGGDSKPGTEVEVEVIPGVKGVMSPAKICGLFRVLDYVTKADLKEGEPPVGLAAPNTDAGGGGLGVELMGEEGVVALESGDDDEEKDVGESAASEPLAALGLRVKLPTIALLLIESDEDAADDNSGLLMEAAGMSMDVKTSSQDMTIQLHLDSVMVQDKARPNDSPFRNMIYSTPDETSHGGLIHVTYWASTGGVRRVPPTSIADTHNQEYDMVVDARFSTLQMALDRESVLKSTPFYKAITRQDGSQGKNGGGGGGGARSSKRNLMDDARSTVSASSHVVSVARRMAAKEDGPKAILAKASMTSVLFELVRSDPWETVMRAGVSGLDASFSANEGGGSETKASVTLADIELTDVRREAKENAYRMILTPLVRSSDKESSETAEQGKEEETGEGSGAGDGEEGGEEGGVKKKGPLMTVIAKMDGEKGDLDADVHLASFACNLMVGPIKESLAVMNDVNDAVMKMFASGPAEDKKNASADGGDGRSSGALRQLEAVDEGEESGSEIASGTANSSAHEEETEGGGALRATPSTQLSRHRGDSENADKVGARTKKEGSKAESPSPASSICARLSLDDWRINLIDEPSKSSSKVVVLRASAMVIFTRSVTTGDGGDSTEDTVHLSLMKTESLVDNPAAGKGAAGADRRVSQLLEPFSAEVHATLLSGRGSLLSAKLTAMAEAIDARLSYTDMMLIKGIADQAMASPDEAFSEAADGSQKAEDGEPEPAGFGGKVVSILPETYEDANDPLAQTQDEARAAAMRATTRAGLQPSTMAAVSLSATCSMARVVLVNDYEGQGVPVLSFSSRALKAEGSGFKEDYSMEVSGVMEAAFFNVGIVRWEPLCEPWQPVLSVVVGMDFKGRHTIQVKLACEEVVMFDVTSDFMESFLSTYWMLFSDGGAKDDPLALLSSGAESSTDEDDEEGSPKENSSDSASSEQHEWAEGAMPLDGLKEGSVMLKNRSGLKLVVGTTDFPQQKLELGALDAVRLPFEAPRDRARAGQFDLRGKAALVRWGDEDMQGTREELPPLQVDRTGIHVFPLLPTDSVPAGHVVSAPVVVEAYQSQRFNMITRKWSAPYLVGDGPEFACKDWRHARSEEAKERPLDSITLPDDKQWEWRDDWHVDFSKEVGTQIDAAGWEYAVEFGAFNLIASSRTRRDMDQARRRKWIRTRAPKPLPMDDPFRPLHLAWDVDVTPQGRLEATVRSTVQVKNSTGLPLEVRALCSAWDVVGEEDDEESAVPGSPSSTKGLGRRSLGSIAPGSTLDVPVKMVYASHVQVRPTPSSNALASLAAGGGGGGGEDSRDDKVFEWSAPLPLLANNVDTSRDDWVSCREVVSGESGGRVPTLATVRLVVHAETTEEGCVVMTVLPPITVVNALPCPLSFRAVLPAVESDSTSSSKKTAAATKSSGGRLLETGRVPSAETAYLHTLEVGDGAKFSIKIAHHGWSGAESMLPPTREELRTGRWTNRVVTFELPCSRGDGGGGGGQGGKERGGFLNVGCHFEPRVGSSCPALRLHIFCSHWLVDRSGLRLGFGVRDKKRLPVPVVRRKAALARDDEDSEGEEQPPLQVHVSPVEELSCASSAGTTASTATVGGLLYTDREYVFKEDSLPRSFRGSTMIRTACNDKKNGSQHFLRFRVAEASTVHVLFDRRCPSPPSWLTSAFRLTSRRVHVVHKTRKGKTAECPFVVWSRDAPAGSWVNLGGNKASKADTMYLVVVTEEEVAVPVKAIGSSEASSSDRVIKRKISSREDLMESWTLGNEGLALCNSPEERVRVAVPEGAGRGIDQGGRDYGDDGFGSYTRDAWSDELDVPGGANGVFQVKGTQGEVFELAVRAEACPGAFRRTTQVTVVPRYCLVNLLRDENIWLKEPGAPESSVVCLPPGGRLPWHWMLGKNKHAGVRVRTEGTAWSYGDVVIDRVGTTALHIPFFGEDEDLDEQYRGQAGGPPMKMPETFGGSGGKGDTGGGGGGGGKDGGGPTRLDKLEGEQTVVHVDVQLADETFVDEYAVLVVFWKANKSFAPIYSVRNASPVTVRLHQAGANREERQVLSDKAVWKLRSRERRQIGWAYPAAQRSLLISAGRGTRAVELSTDTVGNYAKIPTGLKKGAAASTKGSAEGAGKKGGASGPSFVWASVVVKGATKVIHISSRPPLGVGDKKGGSGEGDGQQQNIEKEVANKRKQESEAPAVELNVDMRGFGLSLIGPVDGRREELIYAQVSNVRAKLSRDRLSSVQASIGSLQVDNYLADGIYPVLMSKREEEDRALKEGRRGSGGSKDRKEQEETPFLQLSIIKEVNQSTNTAHYDYVAFRMLEVDLMADRATLLRLLVWYKPVQGYLLMWRQQLDSRAWVAKRTAEVLERGASDVPGGFVDVDEVRRTARIQRKYFKTLQFHPIILRFSYARTPASNELIKEAGVAIINKIPSMVKSHVDLASYLVEDAFGSVRDISKNVVSHYTVAASMQVLNLVGSMRALGSPADLISNVGGGAKALVYAPAHGLVQGPAEFFEGVGRGAQSFVKGTVQGVFNSVAGVGGAVSDTVSKLTFDDDYQLKRERDKNKAIAKQGGVGQGFVKGGKDIASGFSSGASGIFKDPVTGAKKGGMGGFFKGVGKGLVGAVVKPVVGVTDSVMSVVQGISNEADNTQRQAHLRPRRALTKDSETGQLVLDDFSMEAAEAQALVESGVDGKKRRTTDKYESHTHVGDLTIIFANTRVILIKRTKNDDLGSAKILEKPGSAKARQMVTKTWEEVASVTVKGESIVIARYEGGNISLKATVDSSREELYRQFYVHRHKMGDPTSMRSPEEVFVTKSSDTAAPMVMSMRAHSTAVQDSLQDYTFGSANKRQVPSHKLGDSQILDRAEKSLQSVGVGNWDHLDEIAWELVQNWDSAHCALNATRCLCVVFINASTSTVQFLEMRKRDGHGYRVLMGPLCDGDSQQLMPGGVAILFAWGHASSNILKKGYVVMVAETTAFSGVFALQPEKVTMTSKSGFQAGFLEKNISEWWSKQVVVIK